MTLPARRNTPLTPAQIKAARILARTQDLAEAKLAAVKARLSAKRFEEMVNDPRVLLEAERLLRVEQSPLRRMRIIKALETAAFADLGELFTTDRRGRLTPKPFNDLTPQQRALIQSLKITPTAWGRSTDLKLIDKMAALNLLSRIEGLIQEGGVKIGIQNNVTDAPPVTEVKVVYVDAPQGMDVEEGLIEDGTEYKPLTLARRNEIAAAENAASAPTLQQEIDRHR